MSSSIVGEQTIINQIWSKLMDERSTIIGLLGMGGVGKTTLLRQICNKLSISPHHFDTVIWVTVSGNLSIEKVQDDIWRGIGVFDSNWVQKSFDEKSKSLAQFLCQKKFVLVLDDLWQPLQLSEVGVPCPEPGTEINEFKVILASRSIDVCRKMGAQAIITIDLLHEEYAWELFKKKLGDHQLGDQKILHLAELVAKECQGLPLLLCTVARAMACRTTYEEWKDAFNQVQAVVDENDFGISSIRLLDFCFDSLPSDMTRSSIIYYSLFPEDYSILKNELIDFWICEQLLDHQQDVLNLGYNTIDALIGACLLLEEEVNYVKLQDVVHDFALSMAFKSQMFKNAQFIEAIDPKALKTVGWIVPMKDPIQNLASVPHKFFTFLLNHNPFIMIKGEFSQFMDALTVLVLSNSGIEVVPREISNLVSLLYLNLSHTWIDRLPIELKMLTKLKCLNLEHDCQLRVVPKQLIFSLSSLQVLKMFRCGFSVEELGDNILSVRDMDIDPLLCLNHLKVLSITITCTTALDKFRCNPKLTSCIQCLSLEVFWGSESLDISPLAAMKNLLILEIHQAEKLKKFNIDMPCSELLKKRSFERLREVTVESCSSLQELTWVVLAPNLAILRVKSCEQMKSIISIEHLGDISLEPFAKLEILELESLPELKSISRKALPFQCLKKIKIVDCSLLRELPLNLDSAKANEMVIEAEEDWWRDVEWMDACTRTTFLPFFRPLCLM